MNVSTTIIRYQDKNTKSLHDPDDYKNLLANGCTEDEFDEIEIDVEVEFRGKWADVGYGILDIGGMKVNDSHYEYVVEEIETVIDKDGKDWVDYLTETEYNQIEQRCFEEGSEYSDE